MTEPLVWVPSASGTMPAATAAAEPEDEPPGVRAGSCGLRVLPGGIGGQLGGDRLAQDHRAGRAQQSPPRRHRGRAVRPACSTVPSSVGMSTVSMMSLRPTGTPCSGPMARPSRRSASRARAWASAWLRIEVLPGLHLRSRSARMRARQACDQLLGVEQPRRGCPAPRRWRTAIPAGVMRSAAIQERWAATARCRGKM